jgi:transposase InsO family protein
MHRNAKLTPRGRAEMVRRVVAEGLAVRVVAASFGVCERTARKWVRRHVSPTGLEDRSSRPGRSPRRLPQETVRTIVELRRQRWTGARIAAHLGLSRATLSRYLRQAGLNRAADLEPVVPVIRYEKARPGELLHLDIKKLGRIQRPGHRVTGSRKVRANGTIGWEFVFVAIDDCSRLAFAEICRDERQHTAVTFLQAALAYYASLGIQVKALMTDNGACFISHTFARACAELGLKHIFTRPYTPRTNGKAERFIQTSLREWAYYASYDHSGARLAALAPWLHHYNWHRPHFSLSLKPPASRLTLSPDDLLKLHT